MAKRWDDQEVSESADQVVSPSVPAQPSAKIAIATVVATVFAIMLVFVVLRDAYRSAILANRGTVITAQVLFVRYGSRADTVEVHLPVPINRDVELVAWTDHPQVGQAIKVRYDSANPGLAEQDGSQLWGGIAMALGAAAICSFVAWWQATRYWGRRYGLSWLRLPRWLRWLED